MKKIIFFEICRGIRNIQHYGQGKLYFEYNDGTIKKMIYDFKNNNIKYTEDGREIFEKLTFYEVEDFNVEIYKKLGSDFRNECKRILDESNCPKKIYCYDCSGNMHEVKI